MTLENFLSFSEMKGGISSIAGVEELVSVIQKQKDCVSIDVTDVFKRRSTILSIISATEKKEYLDHFVHLDGLNYLHMWLMEAQKCSGCAVEELINTLLTTIERLPANMEKFISCGIMITVEQLRGHKSITIKNKAKVLLENLQPIHSADSKAIEKDFSVHPIESNHSNITRYSDSSQVENNIKFMTSNETVTATSSNSTCVDGVGDCNSSASSLALSSCQEKVSILSSACPAVDDVKVGPLELEMEINTREGELSGSSSSTLSASMPQEDGLEHVALNFIHGNGELSGFKNVECQESSLQRGMPEFLRTSEETGMSGASHEITVDVNIKPSTQTEPSTPVDSNLSVSESTIISKNSMFGIEDEEMDARQATIEVEREVVGYRELFRSSSNGIQGKPKLSDNIVTKEKDLEVEEKQCDFDLNVDIYKDEIECFANPIPAGTVKFSAPIVVFASKGVPGFPLSPVHFKGELGWKGFSSTSAFRPASPRRTLDGDKLNFVEIDLNVAETQNDGIVDPVTVRQIPVSSGHPSMEVSSRKVRLDLNRLGEEDDVAAIPASLNWRLERRDCDHSSSTASSSCSKQPYMRGFDLNDNPTVLDSDASYKPSSKTCRTCGSDSVMNIKPCMSQEQEPMVMDNIIPARPMMHYPQISGSYGYNVLQAGDASMPPTFLYGPGSTTLIPPQVMQFTGMSSIPSAANRQTPFLMNVRGVPLGLRGPRSTGMGPFETRRRNVEANFNHLFMQNDGTSEEKMRSSSAGIVLKRKETESRQEGHYPHGFKQKPSWL